MNDLSQIVLAACRAHAPQFDRMDAEVRKYAAEQMRAALLVAVTDLVKASRAVLDEGLPDDPEDNDLVRALAPFDEGVPYDDTVEADISMAMASDEELPYECDVCTKPGYGDNPSCMCSPFPVTCEDEGCDHHGTPHVCSPTPETMGDPAPEIAAQCCMCGKKGLSTVEGDGGTECELSDGRWTCSSDCYDRATETPMDQSLWRFWNEKARQQVAEIAALRAENAELRKMIRWAHDTLYEINIINYDHDEVCKLNDASVEVILGLAPILGETHGKSAEWWATRAAVAPEQGEAK